MSSAHLTDFSPDVASPGEAGTTMRSTDSPGRTGYVVGVASLPEEGADVLQLWTQNLGDLSLASAEAKLRSGYLANPSGTGSVLLVRAGASGEAVGVQGLLPRRLHLGSRAWHAASISDFAVAQGHRSLGPALMLVREAVKVAREGFELAYGLPNASATPVCIRGGLRRAGTIRRYVKVLRWQPLLARHMPIWLATALSVLAHPLRVLHAHARRLAFRPRLRCRESSRSWSDPAIDTIWNCRPTDLLLSERTGAMLAWRFGGDGRGAWRLSIATDASDTPCGYVVWRLTDAVVEIGDVFASEPHWQLTPMLLSFFADAASTGATSVSLEFAGPSTLVDGIKRAGMTVRDDPSPVFEVPSKNDAGVVAAAGARPWYLTRFDNDAD